MAGAAPPQNLVILLDACYAGAVSNLAERMTQSFDKNPFKICLLGGAQSDQIARGQRGGHGYFTEVLLQAFGQKPEAGWITMARIQEFVADKLPKLTNSRGNAQYIEGVNQFGSNIRLVKNPLYDSKSLDFYREVQQILELDEEWQILGTPLNENDPNQLPFFTARHGHSEMTYIDWAFYSLDNAKLPLWQTIVEDAARQLAVVTIVEKRALVTRNPLDAALRNAAQALCAGLKCITADQLLADSMDFSKYRAKLMRLYEGGEQLSGQWRVPPLREVYVRLRGEERKAAPKDASIWNGDLQERIMEWLDNTNPADSRLVLIGTYGTGKTSFCHHLAYQLFKQKHRRIPILIKLAEFAGTVNLDFRGFLENYLQREGVRHITSEKLKRWSEAGRLVFLFDGYDEMAARSSENVQKGNLDYIENWAKHTGNKILVTSRPEYFLTRHDEQHLLRSYRRLYCHLLNSSQIDEFLQKRVAWHAQHERRHGGQGYDWQTYRTWIEHIHDLKDLKHRIVLLEMIVQLLPKYIEQKRQEVMRVELYGDYLRLELEERQQDFKQVEIVKQIPIEQRLELMENLAWRLYNDRERSNERSFTGEEAWNWLQKSMTDQLRSVLRNNWLAFLSFSFLVPFAQDAFEFSHKSFLEYLVAQYLSRQLEKNKFTDLKKRKLTPQIAAFLIEFKPPLKNLLAAIDKAEADATLIYNAGQILLAQRLYNLNRGLLGLEKVTSSSQVIVDSSYITCLEYYVFIIDKLKEGYLKYPQHWLNHTFEAGYAQLPIKGLAAKDAAGFCDWLNKFDAMDTETRKDSQDSQAYSGSLIWANRYRLPTKIEANNSPVIAYPQLGAWCGEWPHFELADCNPLFRSEIEQALNTLSITSTKFPPVDYNALDLDGALDRAITFDLTSARALARVFDLDITRVRARARAFDLALDLNLNLNLDLSLDLDDARAVTRAIVRDSRLKYRKISAALEANDYAKDKDYSQVSFLLKAQQESNLSELEARRLNFLSLLIAILGATNDNEFRQARRNYAAGYAQLIYPFLLELEQEKNEDYSELKRVLKNLYWFKYVVEARLADPNFPVWESLRLVYERYNRQEDKT
jgi:hypothetical protein